MASAYKLAFGIAGSVALMLTTVSDVAWAEDPPPQEQTACKIIDDASAHRTPAMRDQAIRDALKSSGQMFTDWIVTLGTITVVQTSDIKPVPAYLVRFSLPCAHSAHLAGWLSTHGPQGGIRHISEGSPIVLSGKFPDSRLQWANPEAQSAILDADIEILVASARPAAQ
jgi:hypothetical protein